MPFGRKPTEPTPIRRASPGWPENSSPLSSTSSSLSSSHYSSDMFPADSSQSDFTSSDHAVNKPVGTRQARGYDLALRLSGHQQANPSAFATAMGQSYSKPSLVGSSSSQMTHRGLVAAAGAGNRLKRVFGGRKKNKSEDQGTTLSFPRSSNEKGRHKEHMSTESGTAVLNSHSTSASTTAPPNEVFISGTKARSSSLQQPHSPVPPPLPPKPPRIQVPKPMAPEQPTAQVKSDQRGSIIPISPGISSAVAFMREEVTREEEQSRQPTAPEKDVDKHPKDMEKEQANSEKDKEAWRKSDSAMSHHTIRPGANVGSRTSRPVSMAESLQSIHTIVPEGPVNKRLSALIGNADFRVAEEDDTPKEVNSDELPSVARPRPSPTSSLRSKNRRSMSLNLGPTQVKVQASVTPSASASEAADFRIPSRSLDHGSPSLMPSPREAPTLTRTAANGIIAPSSVGPQSTGNNIRGRLAAWTATTSGSWSDRKLSTPPPRHSPSPRPSGQGPSLRQTAISMSNGLAPAAGLAKRAVEKMGRAWGGFSSASSSGYASSSSSTGPSSFSDYGLSRTSSNQSGAVLQHTGKGKSRRTPDAPSGAWSINSSTGSQSDSEVFTAASGPSLGIKVRGPLRSKNGGTPVAGGVVFGRDLFSAVNDTAIGVGLRDYHTRQPREKNGAVDEGHLKLLETRRLPALVARCAQHLLLWGVQEEGLFRVSGRPSHVAKLRSEFDTGADFDMQDCSPGELDPHAVASIFKAYLRELPEPILTHSLIPYFEEALNQENHSRAANVSSYPARIGGRGPSLPSGPKDAGPALRKPPSLSTLAMPNLSGMRPPSKPLINALQSLISQLPYENRDLIRTVVELIKATSKDSKATKMPLSNLLLVFCPSLNMNPPLLRVLCEAEEIWEPVRVIDIKREEEIVLDIGQKASIDADTEGSSTTDAETTSDELLTSEAPVSAETSPMQSPRPSLDEPTPTGPSGPHSWTASLLAQDIESKKKNVVRARPMGPRRAHVPAALFKDNDPPLEVSSASTAVPSAYFTPDTSCAPSQDDILDGASPSEMTSFNSHLDANSLSSSAESLATPSSSSVAPSFDHLPIENDHLTKQEPPVIAESIADLSLSTPRRPYISAPISGPIQFPTTGSTPSTPLSPKRSPMLSMPTLSSSPNSTHSTTGSAPSSPRKRMKKPSLHLLFKRSSSSLNAASSPGIPSISGPYAQTARNDSDSSVSTPVSAVTAPQASTYVLDTNIETSPLHIGMGLDPELSPNIAHVLPPTPGTGNNPQGFSSPYHVGETPIADRYRSASASSLSLLSTDQPPSHLRPYPTSRNRSSSQASTASSNHLGLLDDEEEHEDWTQSVLMAADIEGWPISTSNR